MKKELTLTKNEIIHLAKLAQLYLSNKEIEMFQLQLGETIKYVKNLDELDTDNILPTNSVVNLKNITFLDGQKNDRSLSNVEALANTNKNKKGFFEVEKIM